jgi:hypothetical protein
VKVERSSITVLLEFTIALDGNFENLEKYRGTLLDALYMAILSIRVQVL